jgi:hypothetical protein
MFSVLMHQVFSAIFCFEASRTLSVLSQAYGICRKMAANPVCQDYGSHEEAAGHINLARQRKPDGGQSYLPDAEE